ncbi:hypothetical protein GCM10027421_09540 [Microbacterium shaanxiense]
MQNHAADTFIAEKDTAAANFQSIRRVTAKEDIGVDRCGQQMHIHSVSDGKGSDEQQPASGSVPAIDRGRGLHSRDGGKSVGETRFPCALVSSQGPCDLQRGDSVTPREVADERGNMRSNRQRVHNFEGLSRHCRPFGSGVCSVLEICDARPRPACGRMSPPNNACAFSSDVR